VPRVRNALIVANAEYADPGLQRLRAPVRDAEALAEVLGDPAIGAFEVRLLVDQPEARLRREVASFFADRSPDDTLLVHFSCHGVKDESGQLYFAAADTELVALDATALPAEFVHRQMNKSRSRRVVLLLDCCYSGAFARGMQHRADESMDLEERFHGRGRTVLTASSAMEYSFEGDTITRDDGTPSVFTSALVHGLRTGDADRGGDGYVAVDELYEYVYDEVHQRTPGQTPRRWSFDVEGELIIATSVKPTLTELPSELRAALTSPFAGTRLDAVNELQRLLAGRHRGLAASAREVLEGLSADDDSSRVRTAATTAVATPTTPSDTLTDRQRSERTHQADEPRRAMRQVPKGEAGTRPPDEQEQEAVEETDAAHPPAEAPQGIPARDEIISEDQRLGLVQLEDGRRQADEPGGPHAYGQESAREAAAPSAAGTPAEVGGLSEGMNLEDPDATVPSVPPQPSTVAKVPLLRKARAQADGVGASAPATTEDVSCRDRPLDERGVSRKVSDVQEEGAAVVPATVGPRSRRRRPRSDRELSPLVSASEPSGGVLTTPLQTPDSRERGGHNKVHRSKRATLLITGAAALAVLIVMSVLIVTLFRNDTGQIGQPFTGHTQQVESVAWSPDGTKIASGSTDATVRVWDASDGSPIGRPFTGPNEVWHVAWSPDGTKIASGGIDGTVRVSDASDGTPIGQPFQGDVAPVLGLAWSPDGTNIASANGATVHVWDATDGSPIGKPFTVASAGYVSDVAWSPDGTKIASAVGDTVQVWDATNGGPIGRNFTGHTETVVAVAWSPDGTKIASGSLDKTVRLWDATLGSPIGEPFTGHTEPVFAVAWSPDGTKIASGSGDKTVRVSDATDGSPVGQPFKGHTGTPGSVAWSPDGTKIASGSVDKTVRVWDATTRN
jgi:WD40 repeat protein